MLLYFLDFLRQKLDDYVATLPVKTYVVRMGVRTGLIRARLRGSSLQWLLDWEYIDCYSSVTVIAHSNLKIWKHRAILHLKIKYRILDVISLCLELWSSHLPVLIVVWSLSIVSLRCVLINRLYCCCCCCFFPFRGESGKGPSDNIPWCSLWVHWGLVGASALRNTQKSVRIQHHRGSSSSSSCNQSDNFNLY